MFVVFKPDEEKVVGGTRVQGPTNRRIESGDKRIQQKLHANKGRIFRLKQIKNFCVCHFLKKILDREKKVF